MIQDSIPAMRVLTAIFFAGCSAAHHNEFEGVPEKQKAAMQGTSEVCRGVRPSVGNEIRNGHVLAIPTGETPASLAKQVCAVVSDRSIVFIDSTRAFLLGTGLDTKHLGRIYDGKVAPYFWCKAARPPLTAKRREREFNATHSPELDQALSRACLDFAQPSFLETLDVYGDWNVRVFATDPEYQRLCDLMGPLDAGVACRSQVPPSD